MMFRVTYIDGSFDELDAKNIAAAYEQQARAGWRVVAVQQANYYPPLPPVYYREKKEAPLP
jgi:hypothetical protein